MVRIQKIILNREKTRIKKKINDSLNFRQYLEIHYKKPWDLNRNTGMNINGWNFKLNFGK